MTTTNKMTGSMPRFLAAAVLVATAALLLQARSRSEVFPSRQQLSEFPKQLGTWSGTDVALEPDVLEKLGPGDFLLRLYQNQENPQLYFDLFIAYFRSQRAGDTIHSPQNCLPGAGWIPIEQSRITISVPGHAPFPANRFIIAKGEARQLVLYWYWAHDRGVASDYWAKYYLVADSIRMNRSDGSLVRLKTHKYPAETADNAEQRLLPFTSDVVPRLGSYIPK
jgi:EpsI family protein